MPRSSARAELPDALEQARAEAAEANRRLEALDQAVRGIAGLLSTDRVLQLIVDRVRELSGAQYAALGIVGPHGLIDLFITSGITRRAASGDRPPPRGHGLLGLIIREGRAAARRRHRHRSAQLRLPAEPSPDALAAWCAGARQRAASSATCT